jgi:hypothetical protein
MERIAKTRVVCAAVAFGLAAGSIGCGWSSPQSKRMTMTGVSESGYPAGHPADAGSPALASQKRTEKAKPAEAK